MFHLTHLRSQPPFSTVLSLEDFVEGPSGDRGARIREVFRRLQRPRTSRRIRWAVTFQFLTHGLCQLRPRMGSWRSQKMKSIQQHADLVAAQAPTFRTLQAGVAALFARLDLSPFPVHVLLQTPLHLFHLEYQH